MENIITHTNTSTSLHTLCSDLKYNILSNLSAQDLFQVASVSKQWQSMAYDDDIWQRFIKAPQGMARSHFLRECAWTAGRAIRSSPICIPYNIDAIQLIEKNRVVIASLDTKQNTDCEMLSSCTSTIISTIVNSNICDENAIDVATDYDVNIHTTYIVYVYTNGYISIISVQDDDDGNDSIHTQILYKRILTERNRRISCIDILGYNKMIVFGTYDGWIGIFNFENEEMEMKHISEHSICSICSNEIEYILIGSEGGEMISIDIRKGIRLIRSFIGPCSCEISSVKGDGNGVIIAGMKHRIRGNGHRASAIAWDSRQGSRLGGFGRIGEKSSTSAFPMEEVKWICMDEMNDKRVGLLMGDVIRIYSIGDWNCNIEMKFGDLAGTMDMNDNRLMVGLNHDMNHEMHVLEFDKALEWMPKQVECFQPQLEIQRDYWK